MKKLLILSAMGGMLLRQLAAQANMIPPKVSAAFSAQYPAVTAPRWKSAAAGYEATFHTGNGDCHVYYAPGGGWIKTETHIRWTKNLPPSVRRGFRNSPYVSWYVENIWETAGAAQQVVTIDVSQVINYQAGGLYKDVYRLYFSMDGKLLKTEKIA